MAFYFKEVSVDGEKVLLVEDDEFQRSYYSQELERDGYHVSWARDGWEAISSIEDKHPDAVVLDIVMPGMDGIETLSKIKARHPKLPVVLHSSYSSFQNNFLCWIADAFITKSPDAASLKQAIRRLLSKSGSHKSF
ncbi:MAG: response regulator [Candidatus Brocadiales bacterium]|nr:response regulator [Candidatus Brocadiales bacterium]